MASIVILTPTHEAGRHLEPFAKALAPTVRVVGDVAACAELAKAGGRPLILAPPGEVGALRRDPVCADLAIVAFVAPISDAARRHEAWAAMATSLADEVLVAPFDGAEFAARCARAQARRAPRGTGERRMRDRLTGALTRTGLAVETPRFEDLRKQGPVAVFRAALPGLARINAAYGAFIGDGVLQAAALRLREQAASRAILARVSGNEFLLIEFGEAAHADARLEALREAMGAPFDIAGDEHHIETRLARTLSSGREASFVELIDAALGAGAARGETRPSPIAAPERPPQAVAPLPAEIAAMSARLDLQYQPQVSLLTGRIIGGEAMPRWRGEGAAGAVLWPREDARRAALTEWTLRRVAADLAVWSAYAGPESRVSILVGAREILDGTLVALCRRLVEERVLDARCIDFDAPCAILAPSHARLTELAALGFSLTLDVADDATPQTLPAAGLARVKLDRDALAQPGGRAVLEQACARNLPVIATRLESALQVALARQVGCAQAQGHIFVPPAPLADLARRAA